MNREHLRAFANRDWNKIEQSKRAHQARIFQQGGAAATVRLARELFAHARAIDPAWPSQREREADLAHQVELKRLLDRAGAAWKIRDGHPGR
jgi:hypothetical protein